jgi:hypothetical protein
MSDYNKSTNFTSKDTLPSGNTNKIVRGSELDTEFNAISAAVASKANSNSPTFSGTPTTPTASAGDSSLQVASTAFVSTEIDSALVNATVTGWNISASTITDSNITVKNGTTAARPSTPSDGIIRFNTTTNQYEGNKTVAGGSILSITRVTTTATLTTNVPHGLSTGDYITVTGASPTNYNGNYNITVTGSTTFTYVMASTPVSDAITVGTFAIHIWTQLGGGATGTGNDQVFVLNDQYVTADYAIPTGKNATSAGPITINTGVTVTIPTDSTWVIV